MAKSRDYWRKRFELLEDMQNRKGVNYNKDLEKAYLQTMAAIEKDILRWYNRFAINNEISLAEAKRLLKTNELKEFLWTVEEYIEYGEKNALNQMWMKQLENASARVHISRLESLQLQLQHHVEKLYGSQIEGTERLMKDIYQDQYYHVAFEIQKAFELGFTLQALDEVKLTTVISKPWTADGQTFSSKIWRDKQLLINTLYTELIQSMARGEAPDRMINVIAKKMNTSRTNAGRLVMTESAFFSAASQKDAFGALDVEKYEIIATLDHKTSEVCQSMDGMVFKMSEFEPGITANPFHPWCRTTTAPYFEDDDYGTRIARDLDGKTYHVPRNMTYKEWHSSQVEVHGKEKVELATKKQANAGKDREQYKNYQKILGEKLGVNSFGEFQTLKYTGEEKWSNVKANYRKLNAYERIIKNEPLITSNLKDISKNTGVELVGLDFRLKSRESFLRKVNSDSKYKLDSKIINETISNTNDVIRYTFQAAPDKLVDSYNLITNEMKQKDYSLFKTKNTWNDKRNPYNGINSIFVSPNGQKFEVQFHTPESFKLKNGPMHKMYEEYRLDNTSAERRTEISKEMFLMSSKLIKPKNIDSI